MVVLRTNQKLLELFAAGCKTAHRECGCSTGQVIDNLPHFLIILGS